MNYEYMYGIKTGHAAKQINYMLCKAKLNNCNNDNKTNNHTKHAISNTSNHN